MGTRFVACDETSVHSAYKQRIVDAVAEDPVLNELYDYDWPDAPHRLLRNKTYAEWEAAAAHSTDREGQRLGSRRTRSLKFAQGTLRVGRSDRVGMAMHHLPHAVLTPEGRRRSEDPIRHRTAAHADFPVLDFIDRGEIARNVGREAVGSQELAIAETR